ncbi:MAG: hypothetical protein R3336_08420, partial [Phycisphaeraceae bacterium]|nr:hypothetical protein [Phycisphaeraceae bacterium]
GPLLAALADHPALAPGPAPPDDSVPEPRPLPPDVPTDIDSITPPSVPAESTPTTQPDAEPDPIVLPALRLAWLHLRARHAGTDPDTAREQARLAADRVQTGRPVEALAIVEGLPHDLIEIPVTANMPAAYRLAATRATTTPDIAVIHDLLSHPESTVRDRAVLIVINRFDDKTQTAVAESLLLSYDDRAKIAGALLAGLTDLRPKGRANGRTVDILAYRARHEDVMAVAYLLRVGLWLQERVEEGYRSDEKHVAGFPGRLLMLDHLDRSTILVAMLARRPHEAIDFLFNPRGEVRFNLHELLDTYRWWPVLDHFLPEDAPDFSPWADPEAQYFQLDRLRDWAALYDARHPATPTP